MLLLVPRRQRVRDRARERDRSLKVSSIRAWFEKEFCSDWQCNDSAKKSLHVAGLGSLNGSISENISPTVAEFTIRSLKADTCKLNK